MNGGIGIGSGGGTSCGGVGWTGAAAAGDALSS